MKLERREANRSINNRTIVGKPTVLSVFKLRERASKDGAVDPVSPRSSENGGHGSQLLQPKIDTKENTALQTSMLIR